MLPFMPLTIGPPLHRNNPKKSIDCAASAQFYAAAQLRGDAFRGTTAVSLSKMQHDSAPLHFRPRTIPLLLAAS